MSSLKRYLIEFAYNGAKFSGVAKQKNVLLTVYNVIENCLNGKKDKFELKSNLNISSRTDAGVHAIRNTAHFDLDHLFSNDLDLGNYLRDSLNEDFIQNNHMIRILDCKRVNSNFIARHAKSRTYLYRLALLNNGPIYWTEIERIKKVEKSLKQHSDFSIPYLFPISNFTSVFQNPLVTELREPFDRELFFKALNLYNGKHDFSAFTTKQGRVEMIEKRRNPIKNVKIKISLGGEQFLSDYVRIFNETYEIIDVEITAESFLYKMIRKMIGAAADVARGTITIEQISKMMEEPRMFYDEKLTSVMKPNGLFLKNVEYDPNDLIFNEK